MGRLGELQSEINELRKTIADRDVVIGELKKALRENIPKRTPAKTDGTGTTTGVPAGSE